MQSLSAAAVAAITAGVYDIRPRVDLWYGTQLLRADVPLRADDPGSITVDATATVLRTVTLNFASDLDSETVPLLPLVGGPLEPTGAEAYVSTELLLPDGTVESIAQGVFGLRRPQVDDAGGGVVGVSGRDRSQRVIDAALTEPYDIPTGVNYATAIHDLIDAGVPGLTYLGFDVGSTPWSTTAALHFPDGDNRWQHALDMAGSCGRDLRFDTMGRVVLATVPDVASAPVAWSYADGEANLAERVTQALDADTTYSHAAVVGQPLDGSAPVRADAYDTDPTSPTYYLGPFGDRVTRLVSSYIASQSQADNAAAALLRRSQGVVEYLTVSVAPVVAHEDGDVVHVARSSLGVDGLYVLERFPIPLGPGPMGLTLRSRRLTT